MRELAIPCVVSLVGFDPGNPTTLFTSAAAEAKTSASAGFALSADLGKVSAGESTAVSERMATAKLN